MAQRNRLQRFVQTIVTLWWKHLSIISSPQTFLLQIIRLVGLFLFSDKQLALVASTDFIPIS